MINRMPALLPFLLVQSLKTYMNHPNPLFGLDQQAYPLMVTAERNIPLRILETHGSVLLALTTTALGTHFNLFLTTMTEGPPGTAGPSAQGADGLYSVSSMSGH